MNDLQRAAKQIKSPVYLQSVISLVVILRAIEGRMDELKKFDQRLHHVGATAHIRQARKMEEELINILTDPKGMFMMTMQEVQAIVGELTLASAMRLLFAACPATEPLPAPSEFASEGVTVLPWDGRVYGPDERLPIGGS